MMSGRISWMRSASSSDDGSTAWHLIVPVGPEYALKDVAWGEYGQTIAGADSRFDGLANTVAMAAAGSALAQSIRALPGGDCYIPSRAELALCQAILHAHFERDWHWSSTQYSANYAWYQEGSDREIDAQRIRHLATTGNRAR